MTRELPAWLLSCRTRSYTLQLQDEHGTSKRWMQRVPLDHFLSCGIKRHPGEETPWPNASSLFLGYLRAFVSTVPPGQLVFVSYEDCVEQPQRVLDAIRNRFHAESTGTPCEWDMSVLERPLSFLNPLNLQQARDKLQCNAEEERRAFTETQMAAIDQVRSEVESLQQTYNLLAQHEHPS
jgi:hypothetical protein